METGITKEPGPRPGSTSPVEVIYALTREDYAAFYLCHYEQMVDRRDRGFSYLVVRLALWGVHLLLIGLVILSVGMCLVLGDGVRKDSLPFPHLAAVGVVFDLLLWAGAGRRSLLRRWMRQAYVRKYLRQTALGLGRHPTCRLHLRPDHFLDVTDIRWTEPGIVCEEHVELKVAWSAVQKIEVVGPRAFFVFIPGHRAVIVPRGAFPNERAFRLFVDAAKAYQADAVLSLAPSQVVNAAPEDRLHPAGPP
jgi:hypothetical protein